MKKAFAIDFVRQLIEQTLLEEHIKNREYFGGKSQVNLFSFYEQLQKEDEVNRYVEIYRDLTDQQNRTGLIMNGTIIAPENPTITNIHTADIVPMSFTLSFRVKLEDRDNAIYTINHLIEILKGRKHDIAELDNGTLFKVGTIANNVLGQPIIKNGDYIGEFNVPQIVFPSFNLNNQINSLITQFYTDYGIDIDSSYPKYLYYGFKTITPNYLLKVAYKESYGSEWVEITDDKTKDFPIPEPRQFDKWQLSLSFDSIRCDEPRNLNADEYCVISLGGSATLVNSSIRMGNQMTKLGFKKKLIKGNPNIDITDNVHWLEPLEMPSGNNANTQVNQLLSNKFLTNTHTDSLAISLQYTFIVDDSVDLIKQWFKYGRYGIQANGTTIPYTSGITPNMIYEVKEYWVSWGQVELNVFKAKIVESIDIENTESDTLTITIPFQVQGEND